MKNFLIIFLIQCVCGCSVNNTDTNTTNNQVGKKKQNEYKNLSKQKCKSVEQLLITKNTNNLINLDSLDNLKQYFKAKSKFQNQGIANLKINDLLISIDCKPSYSYGGKYYVSNSITLIDLPKIYSSTDSKEIKEDSIVMPRHKKAISKQTKFFYKHFNSSDSTRFEYEINGPEIWLQIDMDISIENMKELILSSINGYLSFVQEHTNKNICSLKPTELECLKMSHPFQLRIFRRY